MVIHIGTILNVCRDISDSVEVSSQKGSMYRAAEPNMRPTGPTLRSLNGVAGATASLGRPSYARSGAACESRIGQQQNLANDRGLLKGG